MGSSGEIRRRAALGKKTKIENEELPGPELCRQRAYTTYNLLSFMCLEYSLDLHIKKILIEAEKHHRAIY